MTPGAPGAWGAVADAVVFGAWAWVCPLAGAVGVWLAYLGARRGLEWVGSALGRCVIR